MGGITVSFLQVTSLFWQSVTHRLGDFSLNIKTPSNR